MYTLPQLKEFISQNNLKKIHDCIFQGLSGRLNRLPGSPGVNVGELNDPDNYNPLIHACIKGSPAVVGALVKAGAKVDQNVGMFLNEQYYNITKTSELYRMERVTPLIVGVVTRNLMLVKKLVQDCGANVNARNRDGMVPLHCISTNSLDQELADAQQVKQEIATLLLNAGADANVHDKKGQTPLHFAARAKDVASAQILLENGTDANARDKKGQTALHIAASVADVDTCRLLMQQEGVKATVNQKVKDYVHKKSKYYDNATPIQLAIVAAASPEDKTAVVKLLIDNGADVTCLTYTELTLLHLAAEAGPLDVVKLLVEAGADIQVEAPNTGLTPVDMAEHTGKQDIVDYLVAKAAESEAKPQAAKRRKKDP